MRRFVCARGAAGSLGGSRYGSGATAASRGRTDCTPPARSLHPSSIRRIGTGVRRPHPVRMARRNRAARRPPWRRGQETGTPTLRCRPSVRSARIRLRSRSQPFGRRSARLIRAATTAGSHDRIRPSASSRPRHVRTVRSDRSVYRISVRTAGKAQLPSGPAWLARPTSTNLHALDGWPPRSAGTGARLSAHEIASTLTGPYLPAADLRLLPRAGAWSQFWSHSLPFGTVHRRPPGTNPGRSRTVANRGERRSALLESVLGKTRAPGRRHGARLGCRWQGRGDRSGR
jgi:hypothetical protein